MRNVLRAACALAILSVLSGCLVPERFQAQVAIHEDGSYTYRYDGTASHLLAAMQLKKSGSLDAKDEANLKAEAFKTAKAPGVKKVTYLGGGRYELATEQEIKPGQTGRQAILNLVNVRKEKDGSFTMASPPIKEKDLTELKSLGLKIDGSLEVKLPSNAKVLEHNADSAPGLLSKAYSWKIGSADVRPLLKFKLSS